MSRPTLVLLSGLDGTAKLFERFVAVTPAGVTVRTLPLPCEGPQTYARLSDWLAGQLESEEVILVAESFSGPLAVLTAKRCPNVRALILCASFVEPPLPRWLAYLPSFVHTRRPSRSLLRLFLTGGDATLASAVVDALAGVDGHIMAERISAVLSVDVSAELAALPQPILFLRGTRDRLVRAKCAHRIRTLRPSTSVVEMPAPHMLLQTHPNEAWGHITAFLSSASAEGRW
jgi:pimeloyl-ACP methyl ester carboxylesterase